MTLTDRALGKYVVQSDGCWQWLGAKTTLGYGYLQERGKNHFAHRVVYSHFKGSISKDLVLDHLCRNRLCVNPAHMECVTLPENSVRGRAILTRDKVLGIFHALGTARQVALHYEIPMGQVYRIRGRRTYKLWTEPCQ